MRKFSNILKKLRKDRNLSQVELAKISNLAPSAISQFESNSREPAYSSVISIAKALQVNPGELFDIKSGV